MKNKSGYSLIEMIVVMTAGTVLMGIAVTLLCALLRAEGTGRALVERSTSLSRLADQFRRDVHAADEAVQGIHWPPDAEGATLRVPARNGEPDAHIRSIEYLAGEGTLKRLEWVGEEVASEESYDLGEGSSAQIEIVPANGRQLVCLAVAIKRAPSAQDRQLRIEAVLGWDHRFAERRKEGK